MIIFAGQSFNHVYGTEKDSTGNELNYRFEYTFRGQITGVLLLVFRYRLFFYTNASVILSSHKLDSNNTRFQFRDIADPGLMIRSWGFTGKTILTGIAGYNLEETNRLLKTDKKLLNSIEPEYVKYVKRWRRCPFLLPPRHDIQLDFQRTFNGIHSKGTMKSPVKRVCKDNKYYFRFNIYPILLDMINTYDHAYFPGSMEELLNLEEGKEWQSPPIDYSDAFNNIGGKAAMMVEKYVKFKQKKTFKLTYQVMSKTHKNIIIKGTANPRVKLWGSVKFASLTRTLRLALPRGILIEDSITAKITKSNKYAGTASCSLKRID
jgi:hypothetical protein